MRKKSLKLLIGNNRVRLYTPNGQRLAVIGMKGKGNGHFDVPLAVAITRNNILLVGDSENQRIQVSFWEHSIGKLVASNVISISGLLALWQIPEDLRRLQVGLFTGNQCERGNLAGCRFKNKYRPFLEINCPCNMHYFAI